MNKLGVSQLTEVWQKDQINNVIRLDTEMLKIFVNFSQYTLISNILT